PRWRPFEPAVVRAPRVVRDVVLLAQPVVVHLHAEAELEAAALALAAEAGREAEVREAEPVLDGLAAARNHGAAGGGHGITRLRPRVPPRRLPRQVEREDGRAVRARQTDAHVERRRVAGVARDVDERVVRDLRVHLAVERERATDS